MPAHGTTYVGEPFSQMCLCVSSNESSSNLAGGIYAMRGAKEASANARASQAPGQARSLAGSSVFRVETPVTFSLERRGKGQ